MSPPSSTVPPSQTVPHTVSSSSFYASTSLSHKGCEHTPPSHATLKPISTPISNKVSGSLPYSSSVPNQDEEKRRRLAGEASSHFLGAMPLRSFLDIFLPLAPDIGELPATEDAFAEVAKQTIEKEMYAPFVCITITRYQSLLLTRDAPPD
jgi:hypothetical protein